MTDENTIIETTEEVKEINNEVLNMTPSGEPIYEDCVLIDFNPLEEKTAIKDSEDIEIYGSLQTRIAIFEDWAKYTGEVENPNTTATNPAYKKPDGTGSLYAPLNEVLNAIKPILSKYGFGLIQIPTNKQGSVSIKTILTHKSGGLMNFPKFTVPTAGTTAQAYISAETYARRGGLNPIAGVHGEVDDDGNDASGVKTSVATTTTVKPEKKTEKVVEKTPLTDTVGKIDKIAQELPSKGIDKSMVSKVIKENCIVDGVNTANYNKIKDIETANKVLKALEEINIIENKEEQ